ncbi:aldehyde dehydrogenase (NADP(+)) [Actinoallomurus iriomotensis]|uniref:Aldehyde dehydrogenase n=1 Tax=Actinoallomurus iriomotensis TaxID=478107 RepID=A0A9W6S4A2_9ACTN|nr:aldehyde dehydrogenase (NADP(+)) [Actinoallomurus iriomotensis]GLY86893.1 aldehyde dehydrogenase [Actinoallomurus iriomotensis]
MTAVTSVDARTGEVVTTVAQESTAEETAAACERAAAAFPGLEAMGRHGRAGLLRAMAGALEEARERVVAVADRETALGERRLNGELTRTCFQLRLFAEVLDEGSYVEATIDHAGPTPMGPRPDLRRMLVPLGPVGVFGASNFPLAFSVPGGDTASALAAGCPVVAKAHPSHPATSQLCLELLDAAVREARAPEGTIGLVHGARAGTDLTAHPAIRAVGFTGSYRGGRALFDVANARPDPIPFYAEMGSLNPLVVTPEAAAGRAAEIAEGYVASFTLGAGQFCTKPGLAFVPDGKAGERFRAETARRVRDLGGTVLLNAGIAEGFRDGVDRLTGQRGVAVLAAGDGPLAPVLFTVRAQDFAGPLLEECFGPAGVLVEYDEPEALLEILAGLPGNLTATVHTGEGETDLPARLATVLRERAGRLVWNGFPTGVAVSHAMHHGGPFPATSNPLHTSVGTTAIRRFLRPVTWQDAPEALLPPELRDAGPGIPRRVDGVLVPGGDPAGT